MEASGTARRKVSHKSCGTVVSLAGSSKYVEDRSCNERLQKSSQNQVKR